MLSRSDIGYRKFNHSPINHYCPNSREGASRACSQLFHLNTNLRCIRCVLSGLQSTGQQLVALKHNIYDDGGLYITTVMYVAVFYAQQ